VKERDPEKLRAWRKRSKPLKSKSAIQRKRGKLRQKTFAEKRKEDPSKYGALFDAVKAEPCIGLSLIPGHRCRGPGRHTAHHEPPISKGGNDRTGQVPVCGWLHTGLHGSVNRTRADTLNELGLSKEELQALAKKYVARALLQLSDKGLDGGLEM
jgi:hypothetical protein